MTAKNAADLVAAFARHVEAQTDAIWRGEPALGNRHARRYIQAFRELREMGDPGRDALVVLLEHVRPDVRVMAAAYLLRHRTVESMAVLREAAKGESLVAFGAAQTIKGWEEGRWHLDPP